MKNIVKLTIVFALICLSANIMAQPKPKFGHINSTELMQLMPGRDTAQANIEKHGKMLESQLKSMNTELETKYQDYLANEKTYSELIKQTKQKEMQDLQERIQSFQSTAQEELKNKEAQLLTPIIDKAKKAIEEVAKENGYTYVFDSGVGVLLYSEPSDNILPLVKKKLNITK